MKKLFYLLFISIILVLNVNAADLTDYCKDAPPGTKESCTNTITFCYGDKEYVGCPYDKTQKIYATSAINNSGTDGVTFSGIGPLQATYINPDIPLERSYIALDSNNRVGFVGCYKGKILRKPTEVVNGEILSANYELVKSCSGSNCLGSAYFFKIINANEKTCNPYSNGYALYLATDFFLYGIDDNAFYNANVNIYIGKDNWNPTNSGHCPTYLNFNPNVNSKMDPTNRYRLSDDQKIDYDKSLYSAVSNFFNQQYDQNHALTGCTTEDTVGFEEMKQCFETKTEDIKKFTCPSDKSGYDALITKYDSYQKECKSKYDELYSKQLIGEDSKVYLSMILNAVNEKIDSCYFQKCGVNETKLKNLLKNSNCSNGCTEAKKDQSDSPTASCWMCVDTFKWIDSADTSKYSSCHPESSISKENCYGTTSQKNCRDCLENVYKSAGVTADQLKCLQEATEVKNKITQGITDSSDEHDQQQVDDNASNTYNPIKFIIPDIGGGTGFGRKANCKETLGDNGYKVVNGLIKVIRILAPIVAIVIAMITLIPAITAKDENKVKEATRKCVTIGIVLLVIEVIPYIIRLIGTILDFDLSCIG